MNDGVDLPIALAAPSSARGRASGSRRAVLPVVVGVAVVVGILLALRALDAGRLASAFRDMGAAPLLLGAAGGFGVVSLQALRWWVVTRPVLRVRYGEVLEAFFAGGLVNAVLPGRAGDLLRVQVLSRRARVSGATLLGTELVDFWIDKFGWLPAFACLGLEGSPPAWMNRALSVTGGVALALLGCVFLLRRKLGASRGREGWRGRFAAGVVASSPLRLAATALTLAALPWVWEALAMTRVAAAAGLGLRPLQAFVVLIAFNLASVIAVPGNLGAHEAASTAVLVSFGVPVERAVAFALVYHLSQLLPYAAGGTVGLLRWRRQPSSAPDAAPLARTT
jgi:uncharacterized membrane protein YbhN (UPF0104 family)